MKKHLRYFETYLFAFGALGCGCAVIYLWHRNELEAALETGVLAAVSLFIAFLSKWVTDLSIKREKLVRERLNDH